MEEFQITDVDIQHSRRSDLTSFKFGLLLVIPYREYSTEERYKTVNLQRRNTTTLSQVQHQQ